MYLPRPSPSLFVLLCRFPFLVVPMVIGVTIGLCLINLPESCFPEAMITFAFDGSYLSTYTKALFLLQNYGYSGTVFVVTSRLNQPGYLTVSQLLEMAQKGWEIGSQGVTHFNLTQLSEPQLEYELQASKEYLESLGLKVESFASPYGKYDERVINFISRYYFSHRTCQLGLNDLPLKKDDQYYLKAVVVKATTNVEEIKQWILRAKERKKWLILTFYQIDEDGEDSWPSENLEEIVKFAFEQSFRGVKIAP